MSALFLPLYFTLSGLNTNLGLLNNSVTWGYLIGVTLIAFTAKFTGCAVAARMNGLVWRESFSIGSLMACKGLVELIVLNIGLQAKIISTRVFTMVSPLGFLGKTRTLSDLIFTYFSSLSWPSSLLSLPRHSPRHCILHGTKRRLSHGSVVRSTGIQALLFAVKVLVPTTSSV